MSKLLGVRMTGTLVAPRIETPAIAASYEDLHPSIHRVVENILIHSTGAFQGSSLRVDEIGDHTLDIARNVLEVHEGTKLPRFFWDAEEGEYLQSGHTPRIEPRHAHFKQKGDLFESPVSGMSAWLGVPSYNDELPETTNDATTSEGEAQTSPVTPRRFLLYAAIATPIVSAAEIVSFVEKDPYVGVVSALAAATVCATVAVALFSDSSD